MFCFCHLWAFYDFKVIKIINIEQNLLKMINAMTPKKPIRTFSLSVKDTIFNSHYRFNEFGMKLQILINNYLWIILGVHDIWDTVMPNTRWLWTIQARKLDGTYIYRAQLCTNLA